MNFIPDQLNRLQWEDLERRAFQNQNERFLNVLRRAKVPGGWLLHSYRELSCHTKQRPLEVKKAPVAMGVGEGSGLTFLPDAKHEWLLATRAQQIYEDIESMNGISDQAALKREPEMTSLSA